MSTQTLPSFTGLGWPVKRTALWSNTLQESISGKQTAIAKWSYPRWSWELTFEMLRQGSFAGSTYTELASFLGFYNSRQGSFDSFLYTDGDDHSVTGQAIGSGDGSTKTFQLVRAFGSFVEPILAPNTVSAVYLNGVSQPSGWSVSAWGSATPGILTFTSAPGSGVAITADFTFYFPCRFTDDSVETSKFMSGLYETKSLKFASIK